MRDLLRKKNHTSERKFLNEFAQKKNFSFYRLIKTTTTLAEILLPTIMLSGMVGTALKIHKSVILHYGKNYDTRKKQESKKYIKLYI